MTRNLNEEVKGSEVTDEEVVRFGLEDLGGGGENGGVEEDLHEDPIGGSLNGDRLSFSIPVYSMVFNFDARLD